MAGEARSARRGRGIAYAVVSAVLFGCIPSLTQGLYAAGATGYQIALVRMGLSALIVLGVCRWRGDRLALHGRQLAAMVGTSLLYGASIVCYMVALGECSAGVVGTLYYTYPLWVLLISALLFRRRVTKVQAVAVAMAFAGTAFVFGLGSQWTWTVAGALLTLGCALSYSVYTVAVARPVLADVAPTVVFFYGCLATVALSAPFTVGSDFSVWLAPAPVALVVVLAVLANTVPYLLYIEATRLAGSQDASLLSYIELAVIVVVSAVATGVVPGAFELVGCALIAAAGLAIALGGRKGA